MTGRLLRWLPGPRHLVYVAADGQVVYIGRAADARHAAEHLVDIAPEYGIAAHEIGVRLRAPGKGTRCA